jgi:hypothetical protein
VAPISSHANVANCGAPGLPGKSLLDTTNVGETLVGYDVNYDSQGKCWERTGRQYSGAVWFGNSFKGKKVVDAILSFHVTRSSSTSQGHPFSGNVSCAGAIQTASTAWMNEGGSPPTFFGTPFLTLPADKPGDTENLGSFNILSGVLISIDVTQAVSQWAAGNSPNYGFVLAPPAGLNSTSPRSACSSYYAGFQLTVDVK